MDQKRYQQVAEIYQGALAEASLSQ